MKFLKLTFFVVIFLILVYLISMVDDLLLQILLFVSAFLLTSIVYVFTGDVAEAFEVE